MIADILKKYKFTFSEVENLERWEEILDQKNRPDERYFFPYWLLQQLNLPKRKQLDASDIFRLMTLRHAVYKHGLSSPKDYELVVRYSVQAVLDAELPIISIWDIPSPHHRTAFVLAQLGDGYVGMHIDQLVENRHTGQPPFVVLATYVHVASIIPGRFGWGRGMFTVSNILNRIDDYLQ